MTEKPQQPTDEELDACLVALGADPDEFNLIDDRVFDALVEHWKRLLEQPPPRGQCPKLCDIAKELGTHATNVSYAIRRLVEAGRVFQRGRGFYVPDVR